MQRIRRRWVGLAGDTRLAARVLLALSLLGPAGIPAWGQAGAGEAPGPAQPEPAENQPAQPAAAPAPPAGLPRGAIVAFMPDFRGGAYADPKGLRRWLAGQGWAICDGKDGTPDLHNRMLMGTERPEDAGQQIGSRNHDHRVSGNTDDAYGRNRDFPTGRGYSVRIPEDSHRHAVQGQTDRAEHIPPSTQVVFIIKTR